MSLVFGAVKGLTAYVNAVVAAGRIKTGDTITTAEARCAASTTRSLEMGDAFYHAGLDRWFVAIATNSGASPTDGIAYLDPELVSTSLGSALLSNSPGLSTSFSSFFHPGQLNPSTGIQKLYVSDPVAPAEAFEFNATSLANVGVLTTGNGNFAIDRADVSTPTDRFWLQIGALTRGVFFEGITDGITGITEHTGANVYPKGLFLVCAQTFRHTATFGSVDREDCLVWVAVDHATLARRVIGVEQTIAGVATGTPTAAQPCAEAPIAGDEFDWEVTQFIADSDATFLQPKGVLMLQTQGEVPTIGNPAPGDQQRVYLKFVDFNPFNLTSLPGVPTRTHGRIRLLSRALVDLSPIFANGGSPEFDNPSRAIRFSFDATRNRFIVGLYEADADAQGTAGDTLAAFYSNAVSVSTVGPPAARDVTRTNDVVPFETLVAGDIGEPVSGHVVTFTLTRRSTINETFAGGAISSTYTMLNIPVDTNLAGTVPELVVVRNGTTTLVLGTNYSFVASTGVLTWITNETGNTITATYYHRQTGASPAHGTLVSGSGQTDENGSVRVEVIYPDNNALVGHIDALLSA